MNQEIAGALLNKELTRLRTSSYAEFLNYIDKPVSSVLEGSDGEKYRVEIQSFWDAKKRKDIRVTVSVSSDLWTSIKPLVGDFIISPDGSIT